MPESPNTSKPKVTIWEMLRDVLIAAMNRGQLLGITLSLALLIIIIKVPSSTLGEFMQTILQGFRDFYYVGYGLFFVTLLGWCAACC